MNPPDVARPKFYHQKAIPIGVDGEHAARATAYSEIAQDIIAAHHVGLAGAATPLLAVAGALAKGRILDANGFRHEAYARTVDIDGVPHVVVRACIMTLGT